MTLDPDKVNDFFITAVEDIKESLPNSKIHYKEFARSAKAPSKSFFLAPVRKSEVLTLTSSLKNSKSMDNSEMKAETLKSIMC